MKSIKDWSLLVVLVSLASCGGGGGSDGSGGGGTAVTPTPTPTPTPGGFAVTIPSPSVTFDFNQGATPSPKTVTASWTGTPPAQVYVGATLQGAGLSPVIPIAIGSTSATATLSVATGLTAGTYSGVVNFLVCSDSACSQRIGGTPIPVNYTVNVRTPVFTGPVSIAFQYTRGTTPQQAPVALNVKAEAGAWTATASSSFITLSKTSGGGADTLNVFFDPTGLTGGTWQGTVTVTGASGTQTVPVTLNLTTPVIGAAPISLPSFDLGGINGAPPVPVPSSVNLFTTTTAIPMAVTSDQPWLIVSNASANAPGNFSLTLNPAIGSLASGIHNATLRIEVGDGHFNVVRTYPVTFNLTPPTLSIASSIVLGGELGRDFDQIPAQVSLNTGTNSFPWSVTGVPGWLGLDRTSGSASAAGQQILLQPDPLAATPGTTTATLNFSAQVNGDTVTQAVPVSFNLDTHRLLASESGVALVTTSDANWRRLSRTVKIRDNISLATPWTATADQSWLTVTPSGSSGGNLVIQADPSALSDGLHLATVSVTSSDTTVVGPERIRVGLWVSSSAPPSSAGPMTGVMDVFNAIASDPIRPYVYTHQTNNGLSTSIRTFNVYTGAEVLPAITGVPAGTLDVTVSGDGSSLFALDRDARLIGRVNLDTRVAEGTFSATSCMHSSSLGLNQVVHARPNGIGVLLTNEGGACLAGDESLATMGTDVGVGLFGFLDVTPDSQTAFAGPVRRALDYTSVGGGTFVASDAEFAPVDISNSDTAVTSDGRRVYSSGASFNPSFYGFKRYDGVTLAALSPAPNGNASPGNVEVGSDDRIYTAQFGTDANGNNIWAYDKNDAFLGAYGVAQGIENRGLVVSGDGMILVINRGVGNPGLSRIPVGPP